MKKFFIKYKQVIMPPYKRTDLSMITLTILVAIAILFTINIFRHEDANYQSHAQTINSVEAESGSIEGNVAVVNDGNASEGKYVVFGVNSTPINSTQTQTGEAGATYYVATTGTNSASCGSSASPCATVNYTLANRAAAGDTIKMRAGTYTNQETITINKNNITLTAEDTANRPQINNSAIFINHLISGTIVSYLRIMRSNAGYDGYEGTIEVNGYPTIIDHNEIWNGNQGVMVRTSQQVTVSNNDIHHMGALNTDADGNPVLVVNWNKDPVSSGFANAIRITGNKLHDNGGDAFHENSWSEAHVQFNYVIIDHNEMYNTQEQCIDTKGTDDMRVYNNDLHDCGYGAISNNSVYGSTDRWEIYNNKIHDNDNFAILNQGGGSAWKIWNNLIYRNVTAPTYSYCAVTLPGDAGTTFYHNVVSNNTDTSGSAQTCGVQPMGSASRVVNNILFNNGTGSNDRGNIRNYSGEDSGTPSYNYVYPTSCGGQCQTGTNAITSSNPGFVDVGASDFHLFSTSANINAGTALASTYATDYDGVARPQGFGWDIGAYE